MDIEKTLRAWSQDRMTLAKKEISLAERREGGLVQLMVDGPFRCHCSDNSINFHGDNLYEFRYDFKIRVPRDTKLDLRTVNDSHILVDGTSGDFRISNVNGGIEMREVEGSGSVSTVNGPVKVTFARNPTGATSFKSVNGTLDVSFRRGLNADVRMKTMNGGMFTDFPVTALPVAADAAGGAQRHEGVQAQSDDGGPHRQWRAGAEFRDVERGSTDQEQGEVGEREENEKNKLQKNVVGRSGAGHAAGASGVGQDTGDKVTVPFRDPSKPRTLVVKIINGGMTIRGYDGKDAIVESTGRGARHRRTPPDGMHQLNTSSGLEVTEENNVDDGARWRDQLG